MAPQSSISLLFSDRFMVWAFPCASLAARQFVFHGAKVDKPIPIFQQRLDKTKSPREKLSWAFGAMEGTRTPGLLIRSRLLALLRFLVTFCKLA